MSSQSQLPRTRLYVSQDFTLNGEVALAEKQAHYLANVLRQKIGDKVILFNGKDGEYLAEIAAIAKKTVALSLLEQIRSQQYSPDIWLISAPLRGGKTEFIVEKAGELGVSRIVPVLTKFSVVDKVNIPRLQNIAVEAAEQCERMDIALIEEITPLQKLLSNWDQNRKIIYGDESGASGNAKDLLPSLPQGKYAVLIGPEGGFASDELELLRKLPYTLGMCMGPRIMRADTATVAALTLLQAWTGDWQHKPAFRNS